MKKCNKIKYQCKTGEENCFNSLLIKSFVTRKESRNEHHGGYVI